MAALVTSPDRSRRAAGEMVKPRFLLDEPFALCHAPSLGAWDLLRQRPERVFRQVHAAAVSRFPAAAPLPGVDRDLANLKEVFGAAVQSVHTGASATQSVAASLFDRPGLLFLATHGRNFADRPLASYLLFSPDQRGDGRLTAETVYTRQVSADLVVMSACYSGLADRTPLPGDDLFGLQRAFLHAGARCVVSSLWDVYDGSGPELMRGFFEQLTAGQATPAALAASQRRLVARLRQSPRVEPWLHPYFWAVYTALGDDRTRFAAPATSRRGPAEK